MCEGRRRGRVQRWLFGLYAVLALGLILLAGCKGGSSSTNSAGSTDSGSMVSAPGSNTSNVGSNSGTSAGSNTGSTAACDPLTRVTITEHAGVNKDDQYAFSPAHVIIKAGQFITFANQSDEIHVLVATPDAVLANSAIDRNEDQPVQFTKAGTYTLESQDAKHRGTMQVIVTTAPGTTCGMSTPGVSVTFTEKRGSGQADLYALAPKALSLSAGQSITLDNQTDQALNFSCKPSADMTEGNLRVDKNEHQVVAFARAGQYACTSTEAPAHTYNIPSSFYLPLVNGVPDNASRCLRLLTNTSRQKSQKSVRSHNTSYIYIQLLIREAACAPVQPGADGPCRG